MKNTASTRSQVATMSAAVFTGHGRIRVDDVPLPVPGPGQVRVRLEGCGVCGSNLPAWEGRRWFEYPLPPGNPGHEGWGVVDELGQDTAGLRVGQRVALLSGNAYAAYDVADARSVLPLPAALEGKPFPGEPLACGVNVFRRSDIAAGQTVAVIGVGFIGAIATALAAAAGARVIAISRRPFALEVARRMGAAETVAMDDHHRIIAAVRDLTGGKLCHRVIEAVGESWPLDLAGELTGERGKLVIAGYHQDGPRQVNVQLWNWRGLDVINAHERDPAVYLEGMRTAAEKVASGELDPSPLYTLFPLSRIEAAFTAMRERPDGFLKALVVP
jgi:threonine dehydrogenase-like Zn-dependent dehydrogenase